MKNPRFPSRLHLLMKMATAMCLIVTASVVFAEPSTKALPQEQVDFGAGESLVLRARPRQATKWVIEGRLASQFDVLTVRARSGDAEVAENLYQALSRCRSVPRTKVELNQAIELLRNERKLVQADGVIADVRSDTDVESLVSVFLVDPYEFCEGLTETQRGSTQEWLELAVNLGNVDAAIEALQLESDVDEQQQLVAIIWHAGEPQVLGARAIFYENRAKTSSARADDLVQSYANQFALNEIAKFFARHYPPQTVRGRLHKHIADELQRLGLELTVEQKNAAIKLAAHMIRANPNCCELL